MGGPEMIGRRLVKAHTPMYRPDANVMMASSNERRFISAIRVFGAAFYDRLTGRGGFDDCLRAAAPAASRPVFNRLRHAGHFTAPINDGGQRQSSAMP